MPVMTLWRRTRALGVVSSRAMSEPVRPRSRKERLVRMRILESNKEDFKNEVIEIDPLDITDEPFIPDIVYENGID